jgi:hypothetical protein
MTTRLSGPLTPSGEICVDNEFAMVNHATTEHVDECGGKGSSLRRAAAELVLPPWGAYPPRLSAANIGYRADVGSTFHTAMRQISDSGPAPQTGGEY